MDNKLSELKAAALAATPGPWMKIDYFWIGRAGAINSEFITCDNGPDAEYIKRVSPDAVLALLAELEAKDKRIAEVEGSHKKLRETLAAVHNTITGGGAYTSLAGILTAVKRAYLESSDASACTVTVEGDD